MARSRPKPKPPTKRPVWHFEPPPTAKPSHPSRSRAKPKPQLADDEASLTKDELCALEKISRRTLDGICAKGLGPRFYMLGRQFRVTREERERWHKERMKEGEPKPIEAPAP
jgi:hypothetical protein